MFSVKSVFDKLLIIKSFLSSGILFLLRKAFILFIIISQSLQPSKSCDFKSSFSKIGTSQGIQRVEIIEAATK